MSDVLTRFNGDCIGGRGATTATATAAAGLDGDARFAEVVAAKVILRGLAFFYDSVALERIAISRPVLAICRVIDSDT